MIRNRNMLEIGVFAIFIVSLLSNIYGFNNILRDFLVIIVTALSILLHIKRNVKQTTAIALIIMVICSVFWAMSFNFEALSTFRCAVLYPALILVGYNAKKLGCDFRLLGRLIVLVAIVFAAFGTVEYFSTDFFNSLASLVGKQYDPDVLWRSGRGAGLGSLFGSRGYFGLCLAMAIVFILSYRRFYKANSFMRRRWLRFFLIVWFVGLTFLTYSKTALITEGVVIVVYIYRSHKDGKAIVILTVMNSILGFTLLSLKYNILQSVLGITDIRDLFNMSGRIGEWTSFLGKTIHIWPGYRAVGTSVNMAVGDKWVADSIFIRLMGAYGIIFFICLAGFMVWYLLKIRRIKNAYFLRLLLLFYLLAGVTIDLTAIWFIAVPVYLFIGWEQQTISKKLNLKIAEIKVSAQGGNCQV